MCFEINLIYVFMLVFPDVPKLLNGRYRNIYNSIINFYQLFTVFFIVFSLKQIYLDYDEENYNIESDREQDEYRRRQDEDDNERNTNKYNEDDDNNENNEIETESQHHQVVPSSTCGGNNGGCDHECEMIDVENDGRRVYCSCYSGFVLDLEDGRRCHGKSLFF